MNHIRFSAFLWSRPGGKYPTELELAAAKGLDSDGAVLSFISPETAAKVSLVLSKI